MNCQSGISGIVYQWPLCNQGPAAPCAPVFFAGLIFKAQLGVAAIVSFPQAANWALAFIMDFLVWCILILPVRTIGDRVAHVAELADALDSGSSE